MRFIGRFVSTLGVAIAALSLFACTAPRHAGGDEAIVDACRAALAAVVLFDHRYNGEASYLLDADRAPTCRLAVPGAIAALRDVGKDAFVWDEAAFGRHMVFCSPERRCFPMRGAVHAAVLPARASGGSSSKVALEMPAGVAACTSAPSRTYRMSVSVVGPRHGIYDVVTTCRDGMWRVDLDWEGADMFFPNSTFYTLY